MYKIVGMNLYGKTNSEIIASMGLNFKQYRLQCKLTQQEIATQTGLSIPTIRNFENGKLCNISLQSLLQLLRAIRQLEQITDILPELPPNPEILYKLQMKQAKRVKHGK